MKYADFQQITRSRSSAEPMSSRAALDGTAIELARGLYPLPKRVRLLGVTVSNFEDEEASGAAQMRFDF